MINQAPSKNNSVERANQRRVLKACCTMHIVHDGLVDMLYALLPVLAQSLGLSYVQVGMIRSANNVATASLQMPAGMLAERFGAVRLLVLGTLLAGIAFIGLAAAESFVPVLIGFLIAGCGNAVQHPLSSTLLTSVFVTEGRSKALGIYNTFGDIGKFTFMGGTLLALSAGLAWQWPVFMFGLVSLVVAAAVWVVLSHMDFAPSSLSEPNESRVDSSKAKTQGWGIKNPTGFTALGLIASLDSSSRVVFLTFVAFLMIEKGVDTEWAAVAVLITLFGGTLGKFACGLLTQRVGIVQAIAITEIWTAVGIAAVIFLPNYIAFAILPILGIALNGTSTITYATVSELVEDHRHGRAYGLIYTVGSLCGMISPFIFGLIADEFGISITLAGAAIAVFMTLLFLPTLSKSLKRSHQSAIV